jgi:hypothetical protein
MKKTLTKLMCPRLSAMLLALAGWLALTLLTSIAQAQTPTPFVFTLDEPCKTSAGVYAANGTLVRTLWSKVPYYAAGTYSNVWDGLDDHSNPVAGGVYQIKVLQHNTKYVWDGAIGNTSDQISGPTVHKGFYPIQDISIAGTNAYYVSGYNEGGYDFRNFSTTDPQRVLISWGANGQPANSYDRDWKYTATDGHWVYFACNGATNPTNTTMVNFPGFVVANQVGAANPAYTAYFSQGEAITNGANDNMTFPSGIYVGTQPGLSGLAVQQSGNLLAVSVAPDNRVYLLNKTSGAAVANFSVGCPGRLNFSPDGNSLWIVATNSTVVCFTNINANPTLAVTISNFSEPLDVAVCPTNANLVLVADGGSSQQIKAFNSSGASLWTYGLAGGYQSNGVAVATNKFWFFDGESDGTFIGFAPDGSFWVGDGGTHRSLHFSAACNYLEQIMYQPHSYKACVCQNNPARVFNQFMEFNVDYTKPLQQAWTLVNNWKANVPAVNISWNEGLYEVTTFPNGRTYGLIDNNTYQFVLDELCELTTNQLRLAGTYPEASTTEGRWICFGADGSARATTYGSARWYEETLNGFDTNNNPVWNPENMIASAPQGNTDPVPRGSGDGNVRATISTNNILISFDQSLNNGFHLGGIIVGTSNWLWEASPAVAYMNGCGTYEISNGIQYAGNDVQAVDRNVIYGFQGEFFRGQGQACQVMHFYDDGLFVGQFGEATPGHSAYEGAWPGIASNGESVNLVKTTNGEYYVWLNDEAEHGPQRWHLVNARNIREQAGSGPLGSTITLTNPPCGFPVNVTGQSGNRSAEISWKPVPGATSYNIYYSQNNGGPYTVSAGSTASANYTAMGLINGQTYYFAVTAVVGGIEGMPSEQAAVYPFDTSQTVLCAGSMSEGGQFTPVIEINPTNALAGLPSWIGAEHYTGVLNPSELDGYGYGNLQNETIGTGGCYLCEIQGTATSFYNVQAPFTVTYGGGWVDIPYLERQYRINGTLEMNNGLVANGYGYLYFGATDNNYHYLTVVSPSQFNNARQFTLGVTSTNNTSAVYTINEGPGLSHVFQFLFKGNITLWASGSASSGAIVQGIFMDNASVYNPSVSAPAPPPGFHIITP